MWRISPELREELVNDLKVVGSTVTKQTIGNTIRRYGLKSCSACTRSPSLRRDMYRTHLKFANDHLNDSQKDWEKVLWTGETKIEFFGINSTRRVWRKKKSDYDPKNQWFKKGWLHSQVWSSNHYFIEDKNPSRYIIRHHETSMQA